MLPYVTLRSINNGLMLVWRRDFQKLRIFLRHTRLAGGQVKDIAILSLLRLNF
jgi:hypothetical protein